MRGEIRAALNAEVDFSPRFTDKVGRIAEEILREKGWQVRHDKNLSYFSSERLMIFHDEQGRLIEDEILASGRLDILLSQRGPLFTFVVLRRGDSGEWLDVTEESSEIFAKCILGVREILMRNGMIEVERDLALLPADGHVTEMDGAPARVFDVLFAELY